MKIWLDTTNLALIQEASNLGILHGVALLSSTPSPEPFLTSQKGPVSLLVSTPNPLARAKELHALSPRIIPAIHCTKEGLQAIHALQQLGIPTLACSIYEHSQVLLAASAGASFIAPDFSHICASDMDGFAHFKEMLHLLHRYNFESKLIAASLKNPEQIKECAEAGVHAVAIDQHIFNELLTDNPLTLAAVKASKKK